MSDKQAKQRSEADEELQREILEGRQFTLEEAVARMVGRDALKGESPVTRLRQCEFEIESWLDCHLIDAGGALRVVLRRRINGSELLLRSLEQPLDALTTFFQRILESNHRLKEFVREADVEWGRVTEERPYFEKTGSERHPEDPYTVDSVRTTLSILLDQLTAGN